MQPRLELRRENQIHENERQQDARMKFCAARPSSLIVRSSPAVVRARVHARQFPTSRSALRLRRVRQEVGNASPGAGVEAVISDGAIREQSRDVIE